MVERGFFRKLARNAALGVGAVALGLACQGSGRVPVTEADLYPQVPLIPLNGEIEEPVPAIGYLDELHAASVMTQGGDPVLPGDPRYAAHLTTCNGAQCGVCTLSWEGGNVFDTAGHCSLPQTQVKPYMPFPLSPLESGFWYGTVTIPQGDENFFTSDVVGAVIDPTYLRYSLGDVAYNDMMTLRTETIPDGVEGFQSAPVLPESMVHEVDKGSTVYIQGYGGGNYDEAHEITMTLHRFNGGTNALNANSFYLIENTDSEGKPIYSIAGDSGADVMIQGSDGQRYTIGKVSGRTRRAYLCLKSVRIFSKTFIHWDFLQNGF